MKLLLATFATLGIASTAHAECAVPIWSGTPDGTTIPEHGSLYVYESGYGYGNYSDVKGVTFSDGVPHRWKETRITDDLVRVDYAAGLARSLTVGIGWEPMTYSIDPRWKAPATAPRVIQYWHHVSEWTCSRSDSWMIQIDQPTAAFRIRWTPPASTKEFDEVRGEVIEYIEPAQPGDNGRSVLEIGKHNCIPVPTIPLEQLEQGGKLELFAIRFDGSEVAVSGLPKTMRTSEMRTSDAGISDAIGYAPLPPAPPPTPPIVTNAASGEAFLVIAGAGVGLLFVGMLLAGRKRTPTPIQM